MSIKLSYIILFYNGQDTIHHCLDSILASGLDRNEYEIIIVDDCSPISAESVLCDYLTRYENIRVIRHKENKRQGGAKNTGISVAQGIYIAFADQDEIIPANNGVKKALDFAISTDVDILACKYSYLYKSGECREFGWKVENEYVATGKEFCEQYFDAGICVCPWQYLYKRFFLLEQDYPFAENVLLEASDWVEWHLIHAKKVAFVPELIYQWNVLEQSTSHQRTAKHAASWVQLGYRKFTMSTSIRSISTTYADKILLDGLQNIEGTILRLWKITGYVDFFPALGNNLLIELRKVRFSKIVNFVFRYPKLTLCYLYLFGLPKRLLKNIRDKFL